MATMKNRLRERLDLYLLEDVRDQVIEDVLEVLEMPTPDMLARGGDEMVGSVNEPMAEVVLAVWQRMIGTARKGD